MGEMKTLHKNWIDAKRLAKFAFDEWAKGSATLGKPGDEQLLKMPAYPLDFKLKLGPSLDSLDGLKPGHKDIAKYKSVAEKAVTAYTKEINNHKAELDKANKTGQKKIREEILLPVLKKIETALEKVK